MFVLLVALSCVTAYILAAPLSPIDMLVHIVPIAFAILVAMYVAELVGVTERPRPPLSVETLFWAIATSCIVMGIGYAIVPTYAPSTGLACAVPIVAACMIFMQRKWQEAQGAEDEEVPAVLFSGSREAAMRGMAELADTPGVSVRAVLLPHGNADLTPVAGVPVMDVEHAIGNLPDQNIRLFLIADAPDETLRAILPTCAAAGCVIDRAEDLVAKSQGRINLTASEDIALLNRITTRARHFPVQRLLDFVLVHLLAIVFLVPALLTAIAVRLTSKGPVLFRQRRLGRWGREFTMFKFRTMTADAERETGPTWAQENDPRVTSIGNFLRKCRLDEIPQLYNVLRGDMSLVGPRPERAHFVDSLRKEIPLYDARHAVRPGLTGWAQIRYNYGSNVDDARKKLGYELFYILHRSPIFYFTVLLETVKVLLFRRGSR